MHKLFLLIPVKENLIVKMSEYDDILYIRYNLRILANV